VVCRAIFHPLFTVLQSFRPLAVASVLPFCDWLKDHLPSRQNKEQCSRTCMFVKQCGAHRAQKPPSSLSFYHYFALLDVYVVLLLDALQTQNSELFLCVKLHCEEIIPTQMPNPSWSLSLNRTPVIVLLKRRYFLRRTHGILHRPSFSINLVKSCSLS
jgi:hypothetical protein